MAVDRGKDVTPGPGALSTFDPAYSIFSAQITPLQKRKINRLVSKYEDADLLLEVLGVEKVDLNERP